LNPKQKVFVAVFLAIIAVLGLVVAPVIMYFNGTAYVLTNGAWGIQGTSTPSGGNNYVPPCGTGTIWDPNQKACVVNTSPSAPTGACTPNTNAGAAATESSVSDGMSHAQLTATTYMAIFTADHMSLIDSYVMTAATTVGTGVVYPGTPYVMQVSSTSGNGYYGSWYTLHQGWGDCSPIYYVEAGMGNIQYITPYGPSVPGIALGSTTEVVAGYVRYVAGQTNYWYLGQSGTLLIFQRESAANVKFAMDVPGTRGVRTATGAAAATGTVFSHSSDYTSTAQTFSINLNIHLSDLSMVYGYPKISYTSLPTPTLHIGYQAVWAAFNNTQSSLSSAMTSATPAWTQLPNGITPGYQDFVQIIAPVESTPSVYGDANINLPIDDGSLNGGNNGIGVAVWAADMQVYPNVLTASSANGAPTVYAPVVRYGLTATVYATGFSVSASNAPQTALDYVVIKT